MSRFPSLLSMPTSAGRRNVVVLFKAITYILKVVFKIHNSIKNPPKGVSGALIGEQHALPFRVGGAVELVVASCLELTELPSAVGCRSDAFLTQFTADGSDETASFEWKFEGVLVASDDTVIGDAEGACVVNEREERLSVARD